MTKEKIAQNIVDRLGLVIGVDLNKHTIPAIVKELNSLFTVEEIRVYLKNQDSFGDALYYLSEDNIKKANEPEEEFEEY